MKPFAEYLHWLLTYESARFYGQHKSREGEVVHEHLEIWRTMLTDEQRELGQTVAKALKKELGTK